MNINLVKEKALPFPPHLNIFQNLYPKYVKVFSPSTFEKCFILSLGCLKEGKYIKRNCMLLNLFF